MLYCVNMFGLKEERVKRESGFTEESVFPLSLEKEAINVNNNKIK